MKIQPVTGPGAIMDKSTPEHVRTARAVAAFNKGFSSHDSPHQQPPQQVVQNQSNIAVEELGAIKQQERQNIIPETPLEATEVVEDAPPAIPEPQKPPEQDPALSRQFAQLARQEKALRARVQAQEQAIKTREAAVAAKEAELASKGQQDLSRYIAKDRLKQDALSVLDEAGVSYDELTQQILNRQPTDPRVQATISRLESQIQELKLANENSQKSQTEAQQQQYQSAVKQIELDARTLVKTDPNFETIRAAGAVKDVVELITRTYDEKGLLLSVEEAAQQVEDYLVEESIKLAKLHKIQQRLQASSAKPANVPAQKQQAVPGQKQQPPPMKTLTNANSSSRQLSARERAILAFKGELKS